MIEERPSVFFMNYKLHCQSCSAGCSSSFQNLLSSGGFCSGSKAMLFCPFCFFWLICSLWHPCILTKNNSFVYYCPLIIQNVDLLLNSFSILHADIDYIRLWITNFDLSTKLTAICPNIMDNLRLWHKFLETIKPIIGNANFRTFLSKTRLESISDEQIIIATPHAFAKETLYQKHSSLIEQIFADLLKKKMKVEFVVKEVEGKQQNEEEDFFQPVRAQSIILNPKYTLENFVVGPSNNVAYAAAQAVVQNPGVSYNPLFFYGGTGVGKTHLMLAIGNAVLAKKPHLKILYCSSEKFTNDYVEAIQNRRMGDLRTKYRSVDLLLVDDAQFFSGREQTQEEFFHTFNELTSKNSQIVLTSDRSPSEMPKLEDRLKSRFQGGLMVDIQPPDIDTRVAILKAKCATRGELLPEDCLSFIAEVTVTNARELEGKLIKILQVLNARKLPPTIDSIKLILGQKPPAQLSNISHKQVLSAVCQHFDIKLNELVGPKRVKGLVLPRHLTMHILSEDLNLTVEKIGEILGGRDHTTVMHGRDKIKKLAVTDKEVQKALMDVKEKCLVLSA